MNFNLKVGTILSSLCLLANPTRAATLSISGYGHAYGIVNYGVLSKDKDLNGQWASISETLYYPDDLSNCSGTYTIYAQTAFISSSLPRLGLSYGGASTYYQIIFEQGKIVSFGGSAGNRDTEDFEFDNRGVHIFTDSGRFSDYRFPDVNYGVSILQSSIAEPFTWMMLVVGFGVLGSMSRIKSRIVFTSND